MLTPDLWLTTTTGWGVHRLDSPLDAPESEVRQALQLVAGSGDHVLIFCRVDTSAVEPCWQLLNSGFFPVDIGISLESTGRTRHQEQSHLVRRANPADREEVLRIAESSFQFSRFHLDPRIPNDIADRIKRRWAESYFDGARGDAIYVAYLGEQVVGFLATMITSDRQGETAVIDLIGVDRNARGLGVGASLVSYFEKEWLDQCRVLRVGTQAANTSSIRFYENQGFRVRSSEYVLHAHCENGRLIR
jgi:ribosomal protein S18 acetylase RimI-like enzyme